MKDEKKKDTLRKTSIICSISAIIICVIATIVEYILNKKVDTIWIILFFANLSLMLVNISLKNK